VFIKRFAAAAIVSAVSVVGLAPAAQADPGTSETTIVKIRPGIIDWDFNKPVTPRIIDWDSIPKAPGGPIATAIDWD